MNFQLYDFNILASHCLHGHNLIDLLRELRIRPSLFRSIPSILCCRKITMKHCPIEFDIWWIRIGLMIPMSKQICYFRSELCLASILAFLSFLSFYLAARLPVVLFAYTTCFWDSGTFFAVRITNQRLCHRFKVSVRPKYTYYPGND